MFGDIFISLAGLADGLGDGVGGGPGGLEVEAARDAIDVEHLTCEVNVPHRVSATS